MLERGGARGGCVHGAVKSNAYRMEARIEAKVPRAKKSVALGRSFPAAMGFADFG